MGALFRLIINLLILVVAVVAIYIIGLMFHIVPLDFTPQVLFKDQYSSFKQMLGCSANAKTGPCSFLESMENSYSPQPAKDMPPKPTTNAPAMATPPTMAPAPSMPGMTTAPAATTVPATNTAPAKPAAMAPAPQMPGALPPSQLPATAPAPQMPATPASQAPATPAVPVQQAPAQTQSTDSVSKAKEVVQQYQNSVDQEKKTLDSL